MSKISFKNDYSEGAHPDILHALTDTNFVPQEGYGYDSYCEEARAMIRRECNKPDAEVHFVSGGTQTNLLAISHLLRPHEAVIAAQSGHINVHETGAIESTGHKVCTVPTPQTQCGAYPRSPCFSYGRTHGKAVHGLYLPIYRVGHTLFSS